MSGATQTTSSLADYYADSASPYAAFPQEHRSGGSMPATLVRTEQGTYSADDPAAPDLLLSIVVAGKLDFWWNVGDGKTPTKTFLPGSMLLLPANTGVWHQTNGSHEILHIMLPEPALSLVLDDNRAGQLSDLDTLTDATLFRDETLRRTVMQMWAESARTGGTSDLLMDGLTQVLIARLLDKAGALRRPQPILPLSPDEITRLDDLVEHRLAERLTVEDLARVLDMPRWTFADAFKATTGDTPHSYVTAKRVDKACELLRLGDMPLAEIAYATGFASQSHMTDTFRRVLGTTPGKWRREMRQ
ncbi:AraC family transcriptional regulator [uncultured Roseobacter sp.]|uniref:helix-turn-helix domain-containing protein n=1 Tax=uncultured Roseobacter sp. TaxID=114847 RepID=UPI00262F358F|nr:AraC family transcriptional regulator [uncultured Roseobacter sp.]